MQEDRDFFKVIAIFNDEDSDKRKAIAVVADFIINIYFYLRDTTRKLVT